MRKMEEGKCTNRVFSWTLRVNRKRERPGRPLERELDEEMERNELDSTKKVEGAKVIHTAICRQPWPTSHK